LLPWRNLVCGVIIVIAPVSLAARTADGAVLRSDGGTWMNGNPALNTIAVFPDTLIQTQKGHTAKIEADGSSVRVQPETMVQFEADELVLDHGSLQLNTSREMRVRIGCITVVPVTSDLTQYDVTDLNGKIKVVAYKNDVRIQYKSAAIRRSKETKSPDLLVPAGEQSTRDERCGLAAKPTDAVAAKGAILNSLTAKSAGVAAIGVVTCLALCYTTDESVSPAKP